MEHMCWALRLPLFSMVFVTKAMDSLQGKACPVKTGGVCPFKDKNECPIRAKSKEKPARPQPPKEKKVYLVGTVHVSEKSAKRVEETIAVVLPDAVCLELDHQRFLAMQEQLKQASAGQDLGTTTQTTQGGHFRYSSVEPAPVGFKDMLTLPGLLKWLQQQIGKEFNVMPGAELATAFETARRYNLNVALIDRPINITISKMWGPTPFKEKAKLLSYVVGAAGMIFLKPLFGKKGFSTQVFGEGKPLDMDKLEKGEGVSDLMVLFKEQFPSVYRTLVEERDVYMCNNIFNILNRGAGVLVVVVGMGHAEGMKKILEQQVKVELV